MSTSTQFLFSKGTNPLAEVVEDLSNPLDLPSHRESPHPEGSVSIHSRHPALSGGGLHVGEIVEALGFEDQMDHGGRLEPDKEIRLCRSSITAVPQ